MTCAIEARDLAYRYPNGHVALDGVDLRIEHGERVAVLGPNGAGKTTLMLHLNGLLVGDGDLSVAGLQVERKSLGELRARVGLVFQDPDDQLFMPTVREDVAFGPLNMGAGPVDALARVHEALAAVRMAHAADRAPHELSMGERRRVAIEPHEPSVRRRAFEHRGGMAAGAQRGVAIQAARLRVQPGDRLIEEHR